ncbi:transcription factor glial cells missing-like [Haemaphysalis longicornis]
MAYEAGAGHNHSDWDIDDSPAPEVTTFDEYEEWPDGDCRYAYRADCVEAQRHQSRWVMRHENCPKPHIMKKSCLGVLACSLRCVPDTGERLYLRPAKTSMTRQSQQGKPCPNFRCQGKLEWLPCRGYYGRSVKHFWRHTNMAILFQAKGSHDHPRPTQC